MIEIDKQITLKPVSESDKPNLIKYISDASVFANTLVIPYPYTEKDADEYVDFNRKFESEHKVQCNWGIHIPEAGFIGGIGLLFDDGVGSHKSKFGYWIGEPFRGRGIMTKVVEIFANHVMALYDMKRLEAYVFSDNRASMRVLEKAGFIYEGESRKHTRKGDELLNVLRYAMIV